MNQQETSYLLSDWKGLYRGIEYASGAAVNALDVFPLVTRIQHVNVLRIQLLAPNISFFTTPPADPTVPKKHFGQTVGQTISGFLTQYPNLRVAINANLSWMDNPAVGASFSLFGLAMSQGVMVCDPTKPAPQPNPTNLPDVPDRTYAGAMALLISQDNKKVSFQLATEEDPFDTSGYYTAIAGSNNPPGGWPPQKPLVEAYPLLIESGQILPKPYTSPPEGTAGRTAAGVSADGQYLYLLTIDGRENTTPPYGGAFYDVARWLTLASGDTVLNAINLDGGGSTAMARSDCNDEGEVVVTLINVPYGDERTPGVERVVGNFLGITADPLPSSTAVT